MELDRETMRRRVESAEVARLATADAARRPHLVPIVFAVAGDRLWTAVDHKPKRTTDLRRLRNIRANPQVSVLVDHYERDWTRLWWVRVDGVARILDDDERAHPLGLLAAKYPEHRRVPPAGPVVEVAVERWTGWAASA